MSRLHVVSLMLACILIFWFIPGEGFAQSTLKNPEASAIPAEPSKTTGHEALPDPPLESEPASMRWEGLGVHKISFEGIAEGRLNPLSNRASLCRPRIFARACASFTQAACSNQ
jgi:hypothetical protein